MALLPPSGTVDPVPGGGNSPSRSHSLSDSGTSHAKGNVKELKASLVIVTSWYTLIIQLDVCFQYYSAHMSIYWRWGVQDDRRRKGEAQDLKLQIVISGMKAVSFMSPRILCKMSALWTPESNMERRWVGRGRYRLYLLDIYKSKTKLLWGIQICSLHCVTYIYS